MSAARVVWEEGTMRAATTELYAILEQILRCYILSSRQKWASVVPLPPCITDLELKTQANTSLALKVIRYVFGKAWTS